MNYPSALEKLNHLVRYDLTVKIPYKRDFDLGRFRKFLKRAIIPYQNLKVIQVAGSKGKGSTARILTELLAAQGKKTGLFISPFIEDVRESISVNGKWITQKDFTVFMERFTDLIRWSKITYFEALTAMGFWYFLREKVDYVVLEVGLGGRLDTTNVSKPVASVITPIEREHIGILGENLIEIAEEKTGIIRRGVPVFCARQKPKVKKLVELICQKEKAAFFYEPEENKWQLEKMTEDKMIVTIWTKKNCYAGVESKLLGEHQAANLSLAVGVLEKLIPVSKKINKALIGLNWPGRFEIRKIKGHKDQKVVLDICHTPESAKVLRKTLDQVFPGEKFTFVMAVLKGKNWRRMINNLVKSEDRLIWTELAMHRGEKISNFKFLISNDQFLVTNETCLSGKLLKNRIIKIKNPKMALKKALKNREITVICGSHFLAKSLEKELL